MKLSVLVAFRDSGDGWRTDVWDFVRSRFSAFLPHAEVVVESDDGQDPFHKTLALNRAAARATGDLFYIADADTWVPVAQVQRVLDKLGPWWWRPFRTKLKLNREDTAEVMRDPEWDGFFSLVQRKRAELQTPYWAAPPLIVHRHQWEAVRGMDEGFRGWGSEDLAFALSLRTLYGRPRVVPGYAVHLWHPRIGVSGADLWPGQDSDQENRQRARDYMRASGSIETMRGLIDSRGN